MFKKLWSWLVKPADRLVINTQPVRYTDDVVDAVLPEVPVSPEVVEFYANVEATQPSVDTLKVYADINVPKLGEKQLKKIKKEVAKKKVPATKKPAAITATKKEAAPKKAAPKKTQAVPKKAATKKK